MSPDEPPRTVRNSTETEEDAWELVAEFGAVKTVYVRPGRIRDAVLLSNIAGGIVQEEQSIGGPVIVQVDFFDSREWTPTKYPMTTTQLSHWKAQYGCNTNTDYEQFIFVDNAESETGMRTWPVPTESSTKK